MRKKISCSLLLLLWPILLWAQEQTTLPELAPREIEIRGELRIAFPSLNRQPLVGFNPPPPVYLIPPDRQPIIYPYHQPLATLPRPTLPRFTSPEPLVEVERHPGHLRIEALGGNYLTREVLLQAARRGNRTTLRGRLFYTGSSGHRVKPYDVRAPFTRWQGLGVLEHASGLRLTISGTSRTYRLVGTPPDTTGQQPARSAAHLRGEVHLPLGAFSPMFALEIGSLRQDRAPAMPALPYQSMEGRYTLRQGFLTHTARGLFYTVEKAGRTLRTGGFYGDLRLRPASRMRLGLALLATTSLHIAPYADLHLPLTRHLYLTLRQLPRMQTATPQALGEVHPYLDTSPVEAATMAPLLYPWHLRSSLHYQRQALHLALSLGYRQSPNGYLWSPSALPGTFLLERRRMAWAFVEGQMGLTSLRGLHAGVQGLYRFRRTTADSSGIPYQPLWELSGRLHLPLGKAGHLNLRPYILGPRHKALGGQDTLPPLAGLDFEASYRIFSPLYASLRIERLSFQTWEYWEDIHERSNQFLLGLRLNL